MRRPLSRSRVSTTAMTAPYWRPPLPPQLWPTRARLSSCGTGVLIATVTRETPSAHLWPVYDC
eukprot:44426-Eustigmatos_ZCMA.PRE.1